jgi:hypothetical protein
MRLIKDIDIRFTFPKFLLIYNKSNEDKNFGLHVSNLDTGVHLSAYDYGFDLKLQFLGFGVCIWWM